MSTRRSLRFAVAVCAWTLVEVIPALADDLVDEQSSESLHIGASAIAGTADPHFHNLLANNELASHVYEPLIQRGDDLQLRPALALSWKVEGNSGWRFTLRPDVRFQDGTPFTGRDVVYTFCRIQQVGNSPGTFATDLGGITSVELTKPLSLLVRTAGPKPLLPYLLSNIVIIRAPDGFAGRFDRSESCGGGPWPSSDQFDRLQRGGGTGPYRLIDFIPGKQIVLENNPNWWGTGQRWHRVQFSLMTDGPERTRALLTRKIDIASPLDSNTLDSLLRRPDFRVISGPSTVVLFLQLDQAAAIPRGVSSSNGRNPFRDPRVRLAISTAIGRTELAQRTMNGYATPANQLLPAGLPGHVGDLQFPAYDRDESRRLLAEAGFPDGFTTVLASSDTNRRSAEVIAHLLGTVGIKVKTVILPQAEFFRRVAGREFPFYLSGYISITGELTNLISPLLGKSGRGGGQGGGRGQINHFGNVVPGLDDLLDRLETILNDADRLPLLEQAARLVHNESAVIPLYFSRGLWAARANLTFQPRMDRHLWAKEIRPVEPATAVERAAPGKSADSRTESEPLDHHDPE
jgi:peptide/nickel transport system substrate-binding protein